MDNTKQHSIDTSEPDLKKIVHESTTILIFLPNTNELQRFIFSNAFSELEKYHTLRYVLPTTEAEKMRALSPDILTPFNTSELSIPAKRFEKWSQLFQTACLYYANTSRSFAIRANITEQKIDSNWFKTLSMNCCKFILRVNKYFLRFSYWPKRIFRYLKKWNILLKEKITNTNRPNLLCEKEYSAFVNETLNSLKPLQELADLFDHYNPLYCIVPTSLLDLFCNDVVWACDIEKVTCLILQSGWDNLSSKGILHSPTPFIGCWGPQSARHAHNIQKLTQSHIHNLGAPHYEFLKPASPEVIRKTRLALGIQENERLIVFGGAFRQFDEISVLRFLDKKISTGVLRKVKILYRPHPWRATRQYEDNFFQHHWNHVIFDLDMQDRYLREQAEKGYIKRHVPVFDMVYLSNILSAADAVISPMSTLLIESLILHKPTMAIAFGDNKHSHNPSITSQMTHFSEIKTSKALIWCDNEKHLVKNCKALLQQKSTNKRVKARQSLITDIVTREPDTYAKRLATLCQDIEVAGRKLRGQRTSLKRKTISHAYGAHLIAQRYSKLEPNNRIIPGYWMHGWIPAYHNVAPALIALHKKEGQHSNYDYNAQIYDEKKNTPQWVSRKDQADYLLAHGYEHVKAIGLPIIYLPKSTTKRVADSLLVMPPHSHKTHGPEDSLAKNYARMIADLKPQFKHIWVGLNEDDLAKNQWITSFKEQEIPVFNTVDHANPDALSRLKEILSTFEYVTTNGFGSHIALAAYCGAKVSIYGPYADFPLERMKSAHAIKMFPELLEEAYYLCTEKALRDHYPFLFVEPKKAMLLQEWGAHEVGESCRVSPEELAVLFQWQSTPLISSVQLETV